MESEVNEFINFVIKQNKNESDKNYFLNLSLYIEILKQKNHQFDVKILNIYFKKLAKLYSDKKDLNGLRRIYKIISKDINKTTIPPEDYYYCVLSYIKILNENSFFMKAKEILENNKSSSSLFIKNYNNILNQINNAQKLINNPLESKRKNQKFLEDFLDKKNQNGYENFIIAEHAYLKMYDIIFNAKNEYYNIDNLDIISDEEYITIDQDKSLNKMFNFYPLKENLKSEEYCTYGSNMWNDLIKVFPPTNILKYNDTKCYYYKGQFLIFDESFRQNFALFGLKNVSSRRCHIEKHYLQSIIESYLGVKNLDPVNVFKLKSKNDINRVIFTSMFCFINKIRYVMTESQFSDELSQTTPQIKLEGDLYLIYTNKNDFLFKKYYTCCYETCNTAVYNSNFTCQKCNNNYIKYCSNEHLINDKNHNFFHSCLNSLNSVKIENNNKEKENQEKAKQEQLRGIKGMKKSKIDFVACGLQYLIHCYDFSIFVHNNNFNNNQKYLSLLKTYSGEMWSANNIQCLDVSNFVDEISKDLKLKSRPFIDSFFEILFRTSNYNQFKREIDNLFKCGYQKTYYCPDHNYISLKNNEHFALDLPFQSESQTKNVEKTLYKFYDTNSQMTQKEFSLDSRMTKKDFLEANKLENCEVIKYRKNYKKFEIVDSNMNILSKNIEDPNSNKSAEEIIVYKMKNYEQEEEIFNFLVIPIYDLDQQEKRNLRKITQNVYTYFNNENKNFNLNIQSYPFIYSCSNRNPEIFSKELSEFILKNMELLGLKFVLPEENNNILFQKSKVCQNLDLKYLFCNEYSQGKLIKIFYNINIKNRDIYSVVQNIFKPNQVKSTTISSLRNSSFLNGEIIKLKDGFKNLFNGNEYSRETCKTCNKRLKLQKFNFTSLPKYLSLFINKRPGTYILTFDKEIELPNPDKPGEKIKYNLNCVYYEDKGIYTTACLVRNKWYKFEDENVSEIDISTISCPSLLIYQKK